MRTYNALLLKRGPFKRVQLIIFKELSPLVRLHPSIWGVFISSKLLDILSFHYIISCPYVKNSLFQWKCEFLCSKVSLLIDSLSLNDFPFLKRFFCFCKREITPTQKPAIRGFGVSISLFISLKRFSLEKIFHWKIFPLEKSFSFYGKAFSRIVISSKKKISLK